MKVRIKFEKNGVMRYIGHLDIMRYFQKAMRRAEVDICYSAGYSPHQIMSFAAPLGVGQISYAEYFDIETQGKQSVDEIKDRLSQTMVPGIKILNAVQLRDDTKNAMASVAAARYFISPKDTVSENPDFSWKKDDFLNQDSILVVKKTKKQEITMDIKPHIFEWIPEKNGVEVLLEAGSSVNIKPVLALTAYFNFIGKPFDPIKYLITKYETYYRTEDGKLLPLDQI